MSNKKTTKNRTTKKKASVKQQRVTHGIRYEIKLTLLIAFVIFLFVALYTDSTGIIGNIIKNAATGLFSVYSHLLPFVIFASAFIQINKNFVAYRLRVHLSNAFLSLGIILFIAINSQGGYINDIFTLKGLQFAYDNGKSFIGAGAVGSIIYKIVVTPFGNIGTMVVACTFVMLFLIISFNITPTRIGKFLGRSALATKDTIGKTNEVVSSAIKTSVNQFKEEVIQKDSEDKKHIINLLKTEQFSNKKTLSDKDELDLIKNESIVQSEDEIKKTTVVKSDSGEEAYGRITILDYQSHDSKSQKPANANVKKEIPKTSQKSTDLNKEKNALKNLKEIKKENAIISKSEVAEVESEIEEKVKIEYEHYQLPKLKLLKKGTQSSGDKDKKDILIKAHLLEDTLNNFKIDAKVVQVSKGPMITRFEIQPSPGVKVSKIVGLTDDIALNMAATSVRIVAPIPGKAAIGIEIPNKSTSIVTIRDVLESELYQSEKPLLRFALGKDISGMPIIANLSKMPHLLIAGATGSGKSVCVNTIIASILYNAKPDEVKFLMIDPKVVELNVYNGIPHLILPVVTDPKKASIALNWAVQEMSERYNKFAEAGVRDITSYNKRFTETGEGDSMPRIVVIIDELADLMMVAPNQVEDAICRLAQMARAAGIHLIVATQRPSVDVITGVIKANIPSRIAFAVSSQIDSRTILDMGGAEKLLGKGDMLYYPVGQAKPLRVQGSFITEYEVEGVVDYVKNQVDGELHYDDIALDDITSNMAINAQTEDQDEFLPSAIEFVIQNEKASTSLLQRQFRIGYNRAARMIDELEARGIVGPSRGSKPREVLMTQQEYDMSGE